MTKALRSSYPPTEAIRPGLGSVSRAMYRARHETARCLVLPAQENQDPRQITVRCSSCTVTTTRRSRREGSDLVALPLEQLVAPLALRVRRILDLEPVRRLR